MDDIDRELWRADKYANIYGQDTAQSYLALVAAEYASGCVWTVAIGVILLCIVYPPALIGVGVLVAAWIVLSAASIPAPHAKALASACAMREKARLDKSPAEQREAAVQTRDAVRSAPPYQCGADQQAPSRSQSTRSIS